MKPLTVTLITLIVFGAWLTAYDVYLVTRYGASQTISWQTYLAAREEPIIPAMLCFLLGVLIGHLFWPNRG